MLISEPSSGGRIISFADIWHITAFGLALTSHVVKSVHRNSHTALLTSVRDPPWFACLYRTDLDASVTFYPMHVLVCLRVTYSIHTAWMTFGPLSTVPTWGTACATANRLTILEFLLRYFLTSKRMKRLLSTTTSFPAR